MTKTYQFNEETAKVLALLAISFTKLEITLELKIKFAEVQNHIDSILDVLGSDLAIPDN